MRIGILGMGIVGRTLAGRLNTLGHTVTLGTRDPGATQARPDLVDGVYTFTEWLTVNPGVTLAPLEEAAQSGDLLVNALPGVLVLNILPTLSREALEGKVLMDISLPLQRNEGHPTTLTRESDESLAERIQAVVPTTRVVKSLNTMGAALMVDPALVAGDHVVFVSGDDTQAKETVRGLLREFGWADHVIHDLGGVRMSRGPEMYSYLLFEIAQHLGAFDCNIAINRAPTTS